MHLSKIGILFFLIISASAAGYAQNPKDNILSRPKLVVGLVIDQMRYDYLYRYYESYGANGFRRLLREGNSCENTFIPYMPTVTGPGHTCVYTGSVPALNGIVGNNWFDRSTGKDMYCVGDSTVTTVGNTSSAGKMSPKNISGTTIGDQLKFATNYRSKVISVAMKDRGAIPPGGHSSNGTYWYDPSVGKWITSSYYMKELPAWLQRVNESTYIDKVMSSDWQTLLPIEKYINSSTDNNDYEKTISGEKTVTFPHKLAELPKKYDGFRYTPLSMTYTFDCAKAAIVNENLGKNNVTDMIAIGISTTDWIGHAFGPNSIEIEDTYLRLDRDIESLLNFLDGLYGKEYVLFLTADHGVSPAPKFMWDKKSPAGNWEDKALRTEINQLVADKFNISSVVLDIKNQQVYLNRDAIRKSAHLQNDITSEIIMHLKSKKYVYTAFDPEKISQVTLPPMLRMMYSNGYNPARSGDIQYVPKTGFISGSPTGAEHGSWSPNDTHIPLLWFGWNVKKGKTRREVYMSDIAPTLAAMLHIQMPDACVGKVITEVIKD